MKDKRIQCMFVGYADEHDGDTYYMWNPRTKKILTTRDVIWMKQMLFKLPIEEIELGITWDEPIVDDALTAGEGKKTRQNIIRHDDDEDEDDLIMPSFTNEDTQVDHSEEQEQHDIIDLTLDDDYDEYDPDTGEEEKTDVIQLRSGRIVSHGSRFANEIGAAGKLTPEEVNYYSIMLNAENNIWENKQFSCVGAGIGGGFVNTAEL